MFLFKWKIFLSLLFLLVTLIEAAEVNQNVSEDATNILNEVEQEPKRKNFGKKYLTMSIPKNQDEAEHLSVRMRLFLSVIREKIWNLVDYYYPEEMREEFTKILKDFPELHGQSLRRALIYGLLFRLTELELIYREKPKFWRFIGNSIVEAVRTVNEIIPEKFLETDSAAIEDSAAFAEDMNSFIVFSWNYDYSPVLDVLKEMHYAGPSNTETLTFLIKEGNYRVALKMISSKEASINPNQNFTAWRALIEAPETKKKLSFIKILVVNGLLDLNWRHRGQDFIQYSMKAKVPLFHTITRVLSIEGFKPARPILFYLKFVKNPDVPSNNREGLISTLKSLNDSKK